MQWWKALGVAAFVGVAATGVLVARSERRFHDYSPEEIRERLHARAEEAFVGHEDFAPPMGDGDDGAAPPAEPPGSPTAETSTAETATAEAPGAGASDAPDAPARLARARRRVATGVSRVRTRLGVRQLPTRRRRRVVTTAPPG